jgi:hypothetical protein
MIALVFTLRPLSRTLWAETRGHTGARTVVVNDRSQPRLTRRWPIDGGLMIGAAPETAGENLQERTCRRPCRRNSARAGAADSDLTCG